MPESEGQVLQELQPFLDQGLETAATPPQEQPIALDDNLVALAREASRPHWYASWVVAVLVPAGPALAILAASAGGGVQLLDWALLGIVLLVLFGPVIGICWVAMFMSHRDHVRPIRFAINTGYASEMTAPVTTLGAHSILVGDTPIGAVHRVRLPGWARTAPCTVIFARDDPSAIRPRRAGPGPQLVSITGPDGRQLYPDVGAVPTLLRVPSIFASILVSFAFTAACNAQTQTYEAAASHLRDINASTPCNAKSKPGDDCWKWVPGTIAFDYWYNTSKTNGAISSTCRAVLRWGAHIQTGDVRTDGVDCTKQLTSTPQTAKLDVLKDYVIQVQVGKATYQTDHWPPLGDSVFTLALIFEVVTILWIVWPIAHVAWAIVYRLRSRSAPLAGIPSPQAPALGSTR